jgi:hypothetical protein
MEKGEIKHRAQGSGHRAQGSGHRAQGSGHRAQGTGLRAQGSGHRAQGMLRLAQHGGLRAKVDIFSSDINFIVGSSGIFLSLCIKNR